MAEGTQDRQPLLTVLSGSPTDEELAALVAAVVGLMAARRAGAEPERSRWAASARPAAGLDRAGRGPDAWRASALPMDPR